MYVHSALGGQRLIGVVQVARSTRPLVDAMGRVVLYLALGSLAAILFAFGAGLWLADKALDPIRRNVASQKRFVSDASHELRTPVTIIQTAAEAILRSRETVPPRVQRLAADISNESQQLGRLVADLGVLAQAGTRQAQMQMEEVSVDQLLENALASARLLARPFDVRLESKISAYGHVLGDAARLHQLLGILVDNAVRHSDRGAAVTFEAEAEARHLVLRVRDHGPGIPEDELPHIFERFYRGSRDRQVEGSGLGLAIARWIVEEHRGQISVRSAAAVGSEFTVVLPLLPAERRVPLTRAVEAGGEPASQIE